MTDTFLLECFNWAINLYPVISSVVNENNKTSLIKLMLESDSLGEMLEKFEGLVLCEEMKMRLSFISMPKRNLHNVEKNRRKRRQLENEESEKFMEELLQLNESFDSAIGANVAYKESRTMQRILKYVKKIPFNIL